MTGGGGGHAEDAEGRGPVQVQARGRAAGAELGRYRHRVRRIGRLLLRYPVSVINMIGGQWTHSRTHAAAARGTNNNNI